MNYSSLASVNWFFQRKAAISLGVIPAKAGIQFVTSREASNLAADRHGASVWIPAFAGMTAVCFDGFVPD